MADFLQGTQIEAHVSRLTNIRTQLSSYRERDGRAADAIPCIDATIEALSGDGREPAAPLAVVEEAGDVVADAIATAEDDDSGDADDD